MTKEQWKERLEMIALWIDGEEMQALDKHNPHSKWQDIPCFNGSIAYSPLILESFEIRLKPKPREWWLLVSPNEVVRVCFSETDAKKMADLEIYQSWKVVRVREVEP